ncbi:hypothetical protein IVA93_39735 (plasmid) [Bradyrhizobium sp. 155]|uniref:hypothetical protein n=1 Tax=unclassified Bradyrhizobium TaxID=2631580 RepID=UPI001FFC1510|nr:MULTISPECIES: hypothetical protein [unclassified Bradyrhizobium]MCK1326777.1 hypothetical protein [Bradyrhizobium sp. 156]UPK15943.1 hypothetical protein IVA93_39735 [Bradyrhizobium sp. 155]
MEEATAGPGGAGLWRGCDADPGRRIHRRVHQRPRRQREAPRHQGVILASEGRPLDHFTRVSKAGSRASEDTSDREKLHGKIGQLPSKLDPHIAAIEGWLATQPQLTALAIVGRLSEKYPEEFGTRQHSIVQRLLRALRRKTAEQLVAEERLGEATTAAPLPGVVDGSGNVGPDPPTALSSSKPEKPLGAADQPRSH